MTTTKMEIIPTLVGQKAEDFIQKAESGREIVISEQQRKIYQSFTEKKSKDN